jgi:hypothetical protein
MQGCAAVVLNRVRCPSGHCRGVRHLAAGVATAIAGHREGRRELLLIPLPLPLDRQLVLQVSLLGAMCDPYVSTRVEVLSLHPEECCQHDLARDLAPLEVLSQAAGSWCAGQGANSYVSLRWVYQSC